MEIQYPHEAHPVYLGGENRLEDLQSLLCSGQGIYGGLNDIAMVLGDDANHWEYILRSAAHKIGDLVVAKENPIAPCNSCFVPNSYLCIKKDGKFTVAKCNKVDGKFKWDDEDVILYFPYAGNRTIDLLYDNDLL